MDFFLCKVKKVVYRLGSRKYRHKAVCNEKEIYGTEWFFKNRFLPIYHSRFVAVLTTVSLYGPSPSVVVFPFFSIKTWIMGREIEKLIRWEKKENTHIHTTHILTHQQLLSYRLWSKLHIYLWHELLFFFYYARLAVTIGDCLYTFHFGLLTRLFS